MKVAKPNSTALTKALLASLAIHSVLILIIFLNQNNISDTNLPEKINSIEILLVAPEQERIVLDEVIEDEAIEIESIDNTDIEEVDVLASQVEIIEPQSVSNPSNEISELIEVQLEESSPIEPTSFNDTNTDLVFELPEFEDEQSLDSIEPQRFSQDSIDTAVSSYMSKYNQQLNQSWLAQCQRYKNQHGTKDCPRGNVHNNRVGTSLATSNSRRENINRVNALMSAMVNANNDSQLRALSGLKSHYLNVVISPAKWTPQGQTIDSFNPELLGPTLSLGGVGTDGATGIFAIVTGLIQGESFVPDSLAEQINNQNAVTEPQAEENERNESEFTITPALFPAR